METTEIIKRESLYRISVIRSKIKADEQLVKEMEDKKHQMWLKIKDFGTADAIHADKGYRYMSKLHNQIEKLKKAIAAAAKKIMMIESGIAVSV